MLPHQTECCTNPIWMWWKRVRASIPRGFLWSCFFVVSGNDLSLLVDRVARYKKEIGCFCPFFCQIILHSCKSKLHCPITNSQFETLIAFLFISSLQTQVENASVESLIFIPTIKTVEWVEKARGAGIGKTPEPSGKTKYYLLWGVRWRWWIDGRHLIVVVVIMW